MSWFSRAGDRLASGLLRHMSDAPMTGKLMNDPSWACLTPDRVEGRCGSTKGFAVCTQAGRPLGDVEGWLVEPGASRARYVILIRRTPSNDERRYLLSLDGARLDESTRRVIVPVLDEALDRHLIPWGDAETGA